MDVLIVQVSGSSGVMGGGGGGFEGGGRGDGGRKGRGGGGGVDGGADGCAGPSTEIAIDTESAITRTTARKMAAMQIGAFDPLSCLLAVFSCVVRPFVSSREASLGGILVVAPFFQLFTLTELPDRQILTRVHL